jgi:hypothetical protein
MVYLVGDVVFLGYAEKNHIPHHKGECEGIWFPHTPAGDLH